MPPNELVLVNTTGIPTSIPAVEVQVIKLPAAVVADVVVVITPAILEIISSTIVVI